MKIVANEFVLPIREDRECHASHFLLLKDGTVYCVYFYGSREGRDDIRIYGSLRNVNGRWSDPEPITEDDGLPHWNPVLFRCHDGRIILFYKVGKPIANWYTKFKISSDECKTWSESRELVPGDYSGGRGPVRNKAIYLSDGSILAPGSTEQGEWKCFFDRSFDNGVTWQRSEDVRLPSRLLFRYDSLHKKGIIQPTIWTSAEGIHALMRSSEGSIFRTDSEDGVQWREPYAIDMPNNNSGIDAVVLPDGRVILSCNPVSNDWGARTPISLFESRDNGHHFMWLTHLTTMPGEYSYPALRYVENRLHVTYTWNRKTIQYFCIAEI